MATRRRFVCALAVATLAAPFGALGQQPSGGKRRIGILLYNSPQIDPIAPLIEELRKLGYVDGKTVEIDYRFAEGDATRLPGLAAELVRRDPDVIFAYGGDVAPDAMRATTSIPIVVMVSNDPVQSGLVASIRQPGGNITGITLIYDELAGKMLELLKEALPKLSRAAVLWNPNHADPEFRETQRVAAARAVQLQSLEVHKPSDFDSALKAAIDRRAEGLIAVSSRLLLTQRKRILDFAENSRIPTIGSWGDWAHDGFLLTYGPDTEQSMRHVAVYVDKILKGARPGDLPIERPARFELVVNTKTATTLGIELPASVLARADSIIE